MAFPYVLLALLIAGLAGVLVAGTVAHATRRRPRKAAGILSGTTTAVLVLCASLVWLCPAIAKRSHFTIVEQLMELSAEKDLFSTIRTYDPAGYAVFAENFYQGMARNPLTAASVAAQLVKTTGTLMAAYFAGADDESVMAYIKKYVQYLRENVEDDPLLVCQIEDSDLFGPASKTVSKVMYESGLRAHLITLIKSKLSTNNATDVRAAKKSAERFFKEFKSTHERDWVFLYSATTMDRDSLSRGYARAIVDLYDEIISLDTAEAAGIIRYLKALSMQLPEQEPST